MFKASRISFLITCDSGTDLRMNFEDYEFDLYDIKSGFLILYKKDVETKYYNTNYIKELTVTF